MPPNGTHEMNVFDTVIIALQLMSVVLAIRFWADRTLKAYSVVIVLIAVACLILDRLGFLDSWHQNIKETITVIFSGLAFLHWMSVCYSLYVENVAEDSEERISSRDD